MFVDALPAEPVGQGAEARARATGRREVVGGRRARSDVHAAVDADELAGDVGCRRRSRGTSRRRRCRRACRPGRAGPSARPRRRPGSRRRLRRARAIGVSTRLGATVLAVMPLAGELDGERLGERDDAALRRGVVRHVRCARLRARRRDRDDAAPTRRRACRGPRPARSVNVPVRFTARMRSHFSAVMSSERRERLDAGAGDEDLDRAELGAHRARTRRRPNARSATSTSTRDRRAPGGSQPRGGLRRGRRSGRGSRRGGRRPRTGARRRARCPTRRR